VAFPPGARLGPFEIVGPLGAGGMGEVYRARDTRLGREVAIKVLPQEYSADAARLQRFEQEARSASALNHPNIVTVHEVGRSGTTPYIAMELVEGQTVGELLLAGPPPVRKLLGIATQVADGLAKAHAAGIVHRDLKPANLMVSTDGYVKILDFGLAKLVADVPEALSRAPTLAQPVTHPGTVLGTASYMSPEQAAGRQLDFRSDQFSFGSILYEMLTGRRAFERPTTVDTLSAILHEDPEPIDRVKPGVPAPLRWILERCLAKDARERYAATLDLARDLSSVRDHISELSGAGAALASGAWPRRGRLAWAIGALAVLGGFGAGLLVGKRDSVEHQPLLRLSLAFSPDEAPVTGGDLPFLALSPDGTRLVYAGRAPGGGRRLYVRPLDRFEVVALPGSEGAMSPFFSPDGQWVGFWADKKLKKVSLAGGRPQTLCDAEILRGASWGSDGGILFSPVGSAALWRVSDTGGEPKQVTTLDPGRGETTHRWPQILPGGEAAIFTANDLSGNYDRARLEVLRFDTGERRTLLEGGTDARYLSTGHLVFLRAGSLFAVPFDLDRLAVTGSVVPVLDDLSVHSLAGFANYAVGSFGPLVYVPLDSRPLERELVWVDRKGAARPVTDTRRQYRDVRISPDGSRLAMTAGGSETEIWIYDLARGAWDRLTSGGINWYPVWSSDGERLAFCSNRDGFINPYWIPIDRSTPPERLATTSTWTCPTSWSPDGRTVILETQNPGMGYDLVALTLDGERRLHPLLETPANESGARLSPDGLFLAYESDDSGRSEIYVIPYPGPGGRWQVSTEGGSAPNWSRDGKELFFESSGRLMAVGVETQPAFRAGLPKPLFEATSLGAYDVAPDGDRFVMVRSLGPGQGPRTLSVVLGWFEDVTRRVQAGN
jgi:serine/threonine-protein kinase